MKFVNVDPRISEDNLAASAKMLTLVFTSLAVRNDNLHVTGLGGDNEVFHKIMNVPHNLVIGAGMIDTVNGKIDWSVELLSAGDATLESTRAFITRNRDAIIQLPKAITYQAFEDAKLVCDKLVKQLDTICPETECVLPSMHQDIAVVVDKFAEEINATNAEPGILLSCIREQVGINRMVRFNLDEHKEVSKILAQVTNLLRP